jgi:hypothetical protein
MVFVKCTPTKNSIINKLLLPYAAFSLGAIIVVLSHASMNSGTALVVGHSTTGPPSPVTPEQPIVSLYQHLNLIRDNGPDALNMLDLIFLGALLMLSFEMLDFLARFTGRTYTTRFPSRTID